MTEVKLDYSFELMSIKIRIGHHKLIGKRGGDTYIRDITIFFVFIIKLY